MQVEVRIWDSVNLKAIAELTFCARGEFCQQANLTSAGIEEKFSDFLSNNPTRLVTVTVEGALIGFLILYLRDMTVLEMNPGQILGGYPVVSPEFDQKKIAGLLLEAMLDFAKAGNYKRIESVTNLDAKYETYDRLYIDKGFCVKVQYVEMLKELPGQAHEQTVHESGIVLAPLAQASIESLYQCYHDAFSNGDASFFFMQNEEERRVYFDTLGYVSAVKETTSFTLYDGERLIGFSYVLPYGEGNCHLSCMCIAPDYRRKGLGQYLLDQILAAAMQVGYKTITLGTNRSMGAFQLYEKNGFEVMEGSTFWIWNG
jgi:GNAT superfamily N-acetyltransferase